MRARTALVIGLGCLIAAQLLASFGLARLRAPVVQGDVASALTPGEFAGTLMLGGFRGLACDILWIRADQAKEHGRHYESVALYETIAKVQPRFAQAWQYLSHDLAYNLAAEAEDAEGKWAWFLAGVRANVQGVERNPDSERILRHLAWMIHDRGDAHAAGFARQDLAPVLGPVFATINPRLASEQRVALPSPGPQSNFRWSVALHRLTIALGESRGVRFPPFLRRLIPLGLEFDGNRALAAGQHRAALDLWLEALLAWQDIPARHAALPRAQQDDPSETFSLDSYQRNEGRLRRRAAELARRLAPDATSGDTVARAILERQHVAARGAIAGPGWRTQTAAAGVRWLDEP